MRIQDACGHGTCGNNDTSLKSSYEKEIDEEALKPCSLEKASS
jgi:hypothetical protein